MKYVIVSRPNAKTPWTAYPEIINDIKTAQRKMFNYSKVSKDHFNMLECRMVTDRLHDNDHVDSPDITKKSTRKSASEAEGCGNG